MELDRKEATGSINGTGSDKIEPIICFMGIVIDAA